MHVTGKEIGELYVLKFIYLNTENVVTKEKMILKNKKMKEDVPKTLVKMWKGKGFLISNTDLMRKVEY